jgi:glutathione S-transferase
MAAQSGGSTPTLWQIQISHYSEKARWALEYKGIDHVRRSPLPGMHIPIALWLTGGAHPTFPVLELDGRRIGDSTAVIAALEERFPQPPLYPEDPAQRARALELEDFFDEELGPHIRRLAFFELIQEPEMFAEVASRTAPGPLAKAKGLSGAYARAYTSLRFGANRSAPAELAKRKIAAAMDRLDAELEANGGEYLVGERFSVADLTAASIGYPLVGPAEGPVPDSPSPPAFERFRTSFAGRPGYAWIEEMFRRHRVAAKPPAPAPAGLQ